MTQPRMLPGGYTPTAAEWATWDIGDWDPGPNRRFRARHFRRLPKPLADAAATKYRAVYDREGFRAANTFLRELGEGFGRIPIRIALSNDDLKSYARQKARACADQITRIESPGAQYQACARIMQAIGITPPDLECFTLRGALARARCEYWWRRQLRKSYLRRFEARAIEAGLVGRQAGLYASNETVRLRRAQKTRNRALLDSIIAVNELGQEYTLAELADLSVSNPRIRRGELMARLAGFERIARTQGHAGELYTLTCPSRMHARLSPRGAENPRYDGSTPRQAQEHLRRVWARMRAALHRRGVRVYGFRIAEPHHDGTPHWHLLLFMAPEHRHMVRGVMRRYALQDSPDEPGADKHRFQFVAIDWNRGSATGYLAKYISKNIDGAHVGLDEYGSDARDSAERVEPWASRW
ncbi:MAG TPA: replication endonuclease, partial [Gammaproteobacteria bacterium]|nr:replication endonuclease [Gammaproteobacteria bacterium]